jgi:hypothetical protein
VGLDEDGHHRLARRPGGHAEHDIGEVVFLGDEVQTVETEKHEHRREAGPLVAVEKGWFFTRWKR